MEISSALVSFGAPSPGLLHTTRLDRSCNVFKAISDDDVIKLHRFTTGRSEANCTRSKVSSTTLFIVGSFTDLDHVSLTFHLLLDNELTLI